MKIKAEQFAKIIKTVSNLATKLGYSEDLDVLGWSETLEGDLNITLAEKNSDKALVFIMPKPKE